ncbi:MAG: lipid-A-disaccharide synthase [Candidatus Zixiibacteriota bacterium]
MARPLLFVSAGDPSGDNATGRLVRALREIHPALELFGLGGPALMQAGQQQLANSADLAVLGFWEVAKRFWFFRDLMNRCVEEITRRKPSCILVADYPGFNLRLARRIKHLGIPIVYYISPQLWAWGKGRIAEIRELIDLMIVILPFEKQFYGGSGVRAEFVGHYLLEDIPSEYIGSAPPKSGQIALLPGSRPQEIARMLPSMLAAAQMFNRKYGSTAVVAALRNGYDYEGHWRPFGDAGIAVRYDDTRSVLYESDLALTASGTATLETAIIGRPMVVVYKTGFLTYQIARRLVTIDKIGLVNLVLGEKVVPELIQNDANERSMFAELERFHRDAALTERVCRRLNQIPGLLGGVGASERAARLVNGFL